ncbi:hypothetical protein ACFX14_006256 [Malus domestica]
MGEKSMNKISLKVLMNNLTNKVIFAECDSDFIDVLLSFLTIPLGKIVRLSNRSQPLRIGCMDNLYGSVENLDLQHFRTAECRDMLLHPRSRPEDLLMNLKLKYDQFEPSRYFKCSNESCRSPIQSYGYYETPPFTSAISSLVRLNGFADWNTVEELTFDVGADEVLNVLMCSLASDNVVEDLSSSSSSQRQSKMSNPRSDPRSDPENEQSLSPDPKTCSNLMNPPPLSKTPLSDTLLKDKTVPNVSIEYLDEEKHIESQKVEDKMYKEEQKIPIKLIVSKSKTKVCYAEAGVDFVNLIFSFLTLPLGFIVKQMQNNSMKGSNDRLYRGVRDLDEQYLKSYLHKKMFPSPELPPKYGYQNHPLGIEESSYEDISGVPAKVIDFVDPKSHDNEDIKACGFMKGLEMFMVTDNLNVSPISAMLGMSILRELDVPVTDIEVRVAHVSAEEAFRLLVASFVCNAALTSAFLAKPKRDGELGYLGFLI